MLLLGTTDAASIRYATGFAAPEATVYVRWQGGHYLVVSVLEMGRAQAEAQGVTLLSPLDLKLPRRERRNLSAWAAALLARLRCRRVPREV